MKTAIITLLYIFLLLLFITNVNAQFVQKRGGICFRNDDNHTKQEFQQYSSIFDAHGFKFCFALNLGFVIPTDTGFLNTIDTLIAHGHEFMDHTPNHHTQYFTVRSLADTLLFSMNPGVDHINQTQICLKIDSIHSNNYSDEGPVSIIGNRVISTLPGEFKNFEIGNAVQCIYLPALNKICTYYSLSNKNINDPDTIYLKTFWDETFTTSSLNSTTYKKLGIYDIFLNKNGINLLFAQTTKYCNEFHITPPVTWIHPGGYFPQFNKMQIHEICVQNGYHAAATYPKYSLKCFNEYDPLNNQKYSIQGEDFNSESQTFKSIKTTIADAIARNKIQIETNHFGHYIGIPLLGGWNAYMLRTDSILNWCIQKNILVKTYKDWASILYDSIPNPYQNVFPSLATDLDEDGFPDGFSKSNIGTLFTSGGAQSLNEYYLSKSTTGYLCTVSLLGGIEKGNNLLEFYTQGTNSSNSIWVKIYYDQSIQRDIIILPTNSNYWKKQKIEFICPDSISTISVQFYMQYITNSNVKLSSITIRKKSIVTVLPDTMITSTISSRFGTVQLKNRVAEPFYPSDSLSFSVIKVSKLLTAIDSLKNLTVHKPSPFWIGKDTVWVKVKNPDESTDTLRIYYQSTSADICKGDTVSLFPDFQSAPQQLFMTSLPSDSTIKLKSTGLFIAVPKLNTRYYVQGVMPLGNIIIDSIEINLQIMPLPELTMTGNNPFCASDSVALTALPNNYTTVWFRNDTLVSGNDTLASFHATLPGDYSVIQYNINGCKNNSAVITLEQYPELQLSISADTLVCANIDSLTLFVQHSNAEEVVWSTTGDGILTVLPDQHLKYIPGITDLTTGTTTLSVTATGIANCRIINDSIHIFYIPLPSQPVFPIGPDSLCMNSPNTVFATNGSANSDFYQWNIFPENAGDLINPALAYTQVDWKSSFSGKVYISVKGTNECGNSIQSDTLTVEILPLPSKALLSSDTLLLCQNSPNQFFSTAAAPNATLYQWSITPAYAADLTGNDTTATADWNANFSGIAGITIQGINSCGFGPVSDTFTVLLKPLPTQPGQPIGQTHLCINNSNSYYTIPGNNFASSYQWNLYPPAAGIVSDSAIAAAVDWENNFTGIVKISVTAVNTCGSISSDTLTVQIDPLPVKPLIPNGITDLCINGPDITYSTLETSTANSFLWNISPSVAGNMITTNSSAVVNWDNNFTGNVYLSVKEINSCGSGASSDSLLITIHQIPSDPVITGGPAMIMTDSVVFSNYTAYSSYSDSLIWWIEPSGAAILNSFDSICTAYWTPSFAGQAQLKLKGKNECGISNGITVFTIQINCSPLVIHYNNKIPFYVYPNPTNNGKFNILFNSPGNQKETKLQIIDQLGRKVFEKVISTSDFAAHTLEADVSGFGKGVYYILLGEKTSKFIYR